MMKYLLACCSLLAGFSICNAENVHLALKTKSMIKNIHSVVESGTWFNFILQENITVPDEKQSSTQRFSAKLVNPIYNKNFTELLIPVQTTTQKPRKKGKPPIIKVIAGAILTGTYVNDGSKCSFSVETISFSNTRVGDTEIDFKPGAYSIVNASLPDQIECNPKLNYSSGQLLEFYTKVDIPNLYPLRFNKNLKELVNQDNYVQAYGNSDYQITAITKFTNGFIQVTLKFNDESIKDKLHPVFYDEFDIPHQINFMRVDGQQSNSFSISTYLLGADYQKFGFGVLE